MPLNPNITGKAVADYFISHAPTAGTPVSSTELEAIWEGAMAIIDGDFANAQVAPGTFIDSITSAPITGIGGGVT